LHGGGTLYVPDIGREDFDESFDPEALDGLSRAASRPYKRNHFFAGSLKIVRQSKREGFPWVFPQIPL
jgi:hypothetical protein